VILAGDDGCQAMPILGGWLAEKVGTDQQIWTKIMAFVVMKPQKFDA
jgi:hypothetical protein